MQGPNPHRLGLILFLILLHSNGSITALFKLLNVKYGLSDFTTAFN